MVGLLQELAARELGGSPADYRVADGRVFRAGNRASGMDFAGSGAPRDGDRRQVQWVRVPRRPSTTPPRRPWAGLAGEGLVAAARDNYPRAGAVYTWVASFAQVELDIETGEVEIIDLASTTDCGTVMHPRSLAAQTNGGVFQGIGMAKGQRWVFDPKWGIPFTKRFYTARPPGILDVPLSPRFAAVNQPDPHTARGRERDRGAAGGGRRGRLRLRGRRRHGRSLPLQNTAHRRHDSGGAGGPAAALRPAGHPRVTEQPLDCWKEN